MPTYTVTSTAGTLDADRRQRVATAITRTHHEATGAQTFFAQVIFVEVDAANWFISGAPVPPRSIFVHGQIRGGRSAELKRALLTDLLDATAGTAGVATTGVWVYLVELPAAHMAEFGHVLPEPGDEAQWLANLPHADRALIESIGHPQQSSA